MRNHAFATLLSFTGGFADTPGFLGLQGLFNFVTLGATLVLGTHSHR